eukprot:scaffold233505_cov25-Tisochrysis_lutea.AAC.1
METERRRREREGGGGERERERGDNTREEGGERERERERKREREREREGGREERRRKGGRELLMIFIATTRGDSDDVKEILPCCASRVGTVRALYKSRSTRVRLRESKKKGI